MRLCVARAQPARRYTQPQARRLSKVLVYAFEFRLILLTWPETRKIIRAASGFGYSKTVPEGRNVYSSMGCYDVPSSVRRAMGFFVENISLLTELICRTKYRCYKHLAPAERKQFTRVALRLRVSSGCPSRRHK